MDSALDRARAGERWSLRRRLPDGSASDVVGWLSRVTPSTLVVESAPGVTVVVDRGHLIAARRAPAARGGPDPRRTSAEELEQVALPGWVAQSESLGAWTLRAGGGFTGRANSVLAVGDPGLPLADAAERVVGYARAHRIAPWAQVVVGSDVERGLVLLGWQEVHVTTDVLVSRLTSLLGEDLPDPRVRVRAQLDDAWWHAFARSRPHDADPQLVRMIVDGHPPRAFAAVTDPAGAAGSPGPTEHATVAIARGHVSREWLGLASVWTDPAFRRRGLATAMMRALGHWAARQGTRNCYLQVPRHNAEAYDAYARLGFTRHHSYRYLEAPPSASVGTLERPAGTSNE